MLVTFYLGTLLGTIAREGSLSGSSEELSQRGKGRNIKEKMDKLDCINWTFYSSKDTIKREKTGTESEILFASHVTDKRLNPKYIKNL